MCTEEAVFTVEEAPSWPHHTLLSAFQDAGFEVQVCVFDMFFLRVAGETQTQVVYSEQSAFLASGVWVTRLAAQLHVQDSYLRGRFFFFARNRGQLMMC